MASGGLLEAQKVSGCFEDYLPLRRGGLKKKTRPAGLPYLWKKKKEKEEGAVAGA